jgi:hypothetical protein
MNFTNFSLNETFKERTGYVRPEKFETNEEMYAHHRETEKILDTFTDDLYLEIVEYIKGKTYLEILPQDLVSKKRSLIKSYILETIDSTYEWLLKSPFYNETPITKEQIALYMMIGTKYSNFQLAYLIIPKIYDCYIWIEFEKAVEGIALTREERSALRTEYRETHKQELDDYYELERTLHYLGQVWEHYEARLKVKEGVPVKSYDMEDDGFPSASRGNMCYLFIPVKNLNNKELESEVTLFNPRNKRNENFTEVTFKEEDNIYSAINKTGKKVFFADHSEVAECWDCLFSINKAIYTGWWNKTLILQ